MAAEYGFDDCTFIEFEVVLGEYGQALAWAKGDVAVSG